jgi:transcriptional regulator with XRE-family HTH domain
MEKYSGFSDAVKNKRKSLGWSQTQLAAKVFCSPDTIRAIEQNKQNYHPSWDMIERIERVLVINKSEYAEPKVPENKKKNSIRRFFLPKRKKTFRWVLVLLAFLAIIGFVWIQISRFNGLITLYRSNPTDEYVLIESSGREILDGGTVKIGELVTVKFIVQNSDVHPVRILCIVAGARGPGVHLFENEWEAQDVPFSRKYNIFLHPGDIAIRHYPQ